MNIVEQDIAERRKLIYNAFCCGRDSPLIAAYHGTSIQVLKEIIKLGYRPGSFKNARIRKKVYIRVGDVFVYPIRKRAIFNGRSGSYDENKAFLEASESAEDSSQLHFLSDNLGLRILSSDVDDTDYIEKLIRYSKSGRDIFPIEAQSTYRYVTSSSP
jgi:hypothetical protein